MLTMAQANYIRIASDIKDKSDSQIMDPVKPIIDKILKEDKRI